MLLSITRFYFYFSVPTSLPNRLGRPTPSSLFIMFHICIFFSILLVFTRFKVLWCCGLSKFQVPNANKLLSRKKEKITSNIDRLTINKRFSKIWPGHLCLYYAWRGQLLALSHSHKPIGLWDTWGWEHSRGDSPRSYFLLRGFVDFGVLSKYKYILGHCDIWRSRSR